MFKKSLNVLFSAPQKTCLPKLLSRQSTKNILGCRNIHRAIAKSSTFDARHSEESGHKDKKEWIVRSLCSDIEIPRKTFHELIWCKMGQWESKTALICGLTEESYSYSELRRLSRKIGVGLLKLGLKKKQVVAMCLTNRPVYVAAILGAAEAGLTICSINPFYTPDEIFYQLKNSGAAGILTFPEKIKCVQEAVDKLQNSTSNTANSEAKFKFISTNCSYSNLESTIPKTVVLLNDLIQTVTQTEEDELLRKSVAGDDASNDLAFIAHSSGTTGLPKGVCLTHQNVTASILQMSVPDITIFKETTSCHQDVIPMVLPLFHNLGLEIILDALYHGSTIVTLPKFEEKSFLSVLKYHEASMLFVVPPMILYLGSSPAVQTDHLRSVRCIFTAGAPIGEVDIQRCLKRAPHNVRFVQGYGQTEAMCCLTHTTANIDTNLLSVGVPVPNTLMKVADLDSGSSLPPHHQGEICFKGPQMCLGYLNNDKATSEVMDADGWFHTGDIGYYDEGSRFYVVDRIKEMIKVKGFQVAPAELEALLRSHPQVEDAAIIGVPHERKGETPIGFIKLKPDNQLTVGQLKEFMKTRVAHFKQIDTFVFVDSIPKSPSGKILRKNLKTSYLEKIKKN